MLSCWLWGSVARDTFHQTPARNETKARSRIVNVHVFGECAQVPADDDPQRRRGGLNTRKLAWDVLPLPGRVRAVFGGGGK